MAKGFQSFTHKRRKTFSSTDEYVKRVDFIYEKAMDYINDKIEHHLTQMAESGDMSMSEAIKALNSYEHNKHLDSLEEFKKKAMGKASKEVKKRIDIASRHASISRLQAMQDEIDLTIETLMEEEHLNLFNELRKKYKDEYYTESYELQRLTGYNHINAVDERALKQAIYNKWQAEEDIEQKIDRRKKRTVKKMYEELETNILTGRSPNEAAKEISKALNIPKHHARAMARTETNRIMSKAHKDSYVESGVDKYQILATLDHRTSQTCIRMDKRVYNIDDFKIGQTAPPFHVNCRSVAVPYFSDEIQLRMRQNVGRTARDPDTDKTVTVKPLEYETWFEEYVGYNEKSRKKGYNIYKIDPSELSFIVEQIGTKKGAIYSDKIAYQMKNGNERVSKLFRFFDDRFQFGNYESPKGVTGYQANLNKVLMNIERDMKNTVARTKHSTFFHEFGHAVDKYLKDFLPQIKPYNNKSKIFASDYLKVDLDGAKKLLSEAAYDDAIELQNRFGNARNLRDDLVGRGFKIREFSGLSDILDSTGVFEEFPLGFGHGKEYWKRSSRNGEIFAQCTEAEMTSDKSKIVLNEYVPKTMKAYNNFIQEVSKYVFGD